MKVIENECVGCPKEMGCINSACPYIDVPHFYCDKCGDETKLYYYNGDELCVNCLLENFDIVEGSDEW